MYRSALGFRLLLLFAIIILMFLLILMVFLPFSPIFNCIAIVVVVPTPTMILMHIAFTFAARTLSIVARSTAALGANASPLIPSSSSLAVEPAVRIAE